MARRQVVQTLATAPALLQAQPSRISPFNGIQMAARPRPDPGGRRDQLHRLTRVRKRCALPNLRAVGRAIAEWLRQG